MLKTALSAALVCLIALVGGASSVAWVLASGYKFGAVTSGPWTSFPDAGTREADPYAQAEGAMNGVLSLGRAEGMGFTAERDAEYDPLDTRCAYSIAGQTPVGRFWTLRAEPINQSDVAVPTIHSRGLLRAADNAVEIAVARKPHPGNWLPVRGEGRMRLVFTIYDGSVASGPASAEFAMPTISKAGCDD